MKEYQTILTFELSNNFRKCQQGKHFDRPTEYRFRLSINKYIAKIIYDEG